MNKRGFSFYAALTFILTLACSYSHGQQKADMILYNGKVATLVNVNEFVQAVAVKDGIIYFGSADGYLYALNLKMK